MNPTEHRLHCASYRARWIIPVSAPPIENGRLEVADERIVAVGRATSPMPSEVDLGDVAMLPGFVNAHTHLELTFCRGRVPYRGAFTTWVRDLVALTRSGAAGDPGAAIDAGLRESAAAGVAALADIGHHAASLARWQNAPLQVTGFLEVLGMGPRSRSAHERSLTSAVRLLNDTFTLGGCPISSEGEGVSPNTRRFSPPLGLSPHAPYSTAPEIYRDALAWCQQNRRPLCTHLAETREEVQFLADGTGPFRDLLEEWGLWDGSFTPLACSPIEYARRLGLLDARPLLAHVNYATDDDLAILATSSASVVYCPRTHAFFEHQPHRYRDMLTRGINVCLGTDSLASADSLSILDELRFLRQRDAALPHDQLLHMATLAGARALGLEHELGTLELGKRAAFTAIPLIHPATSDPAADVCHGS
jgi:cytosine/adenosine deaminase-related metal-dependent hydrolase